METMADVLQREPVQAMLARARKRRFSAGEVIVHEGDPADSVHVIRSGRVAAGTTTPQGSVVTYSVMGPGELFGELSLLSEDSLRSATITALEPTETSCLLRTDFTRLRESDPVFADALMELLAARVRRLSAQLVEALYVPAETRVLRRLVDLAELYGEGSNGCTVPITQDDLAALAGAARGTVNRVLRREVERGTLELGRKRITIRDRRALERRSAV